MKLIACCNLSRYQRKRVAKTLLVMKMIVVFTLAICFNAGAKSFSQKITLTQKQVPLEKIFREISRQSGYTFVYTKSLLQKSKRVTVSVTNASLEEALAECFKNQELSFSILDQLIIIREKDALQNTTSNNVSPILPVAPKEIRITGMITNEKGQGLGGATVAEKGAGNATMSKDDGSYSINVADDKSTLVVSFVGYETKEMIVGNKKTINISLAPVDANLGEIVVTGYGTQRKKEITTAVTSIKSKDFNKGNINNPAQLLQGKVAGLSIVAPQGNPNGSFDIRLRGLSTLGANTQPLIIIDGVIGVDLNSVDPNDIASIDVLKDGGAAAIYGTRGSSGVILITTKTGSFGKARIDYNSYVTAENKDRTLPVMDKATYLANGGTDLGGNTNWMDEITRTAISQVHNLSLAGGADQTTYRVSLNYRNVEGVLLNSGFEQLNGRLNLTQHAFKKKLTLTLNLASTSKESKLGFDHAFRSSIVMPPTAPINTTDTYYAKYGGFFQSEVHELYNPLAIIRQNINDQKTARLMFNIQADYKIVENLTASVRYAQNNDNYDNGQYISKYSYYGSGVDRNGLATRSNLTTSNNLFEGTANYVKSFKALNIAVLGGYAYQNFTTGSALTQAGNFLTDAFTYNNFAAAKDFADGKAIATSSKENNKLIAFFGRVNLNYNNIYFLSASLRREGSTRFGEGNKWGNFPGISAGVDLGQLVSIRNVNQLKIRASYGITGAMPDVSYLSQQLYGPGTSATYFLYNGVFTPVYSPQSNANPDLKWETKSEIDFGVDISMFNSRLNGTFDYYNRKTTDALITLNVPVPPNLFSTSVLNAGELKNEGIELTLDYLAVKRNNFSWTTRATFSTYNTRIVSLSMGEIKYGVREVGSLPAPLVGNTVRVEEGKPMGQMIGWVYNGVDANGQYMLNDLDKNGAINELDVAVIGRGLPKGEIGLSNSFRIGQLDLSFFLRGVYGHDLVNLNRTMFEQVSRISSYNLVNTKYFDAAYKGPAAYNSYYLEKASFIKLDNFTVGYNFRLRAGSAISSARAYVAGQNLFYITNYSGVDPEPRYANEGNVLAPGVEPRNSWVTTRTFTLGINLSF